jgi:hypothetical protein
MKGLGDPNGLFVSKKGTGVRGPSPQKICPVRRICSPPASDLPRCLRNRPREGGRLTPTALA